MFSLKNFIKIILVFFVFILFFWFIKQIATLDDKNTIKNEDAIPVIEADKEPYRIEYNEDIHKTPLDESCTLNNEC